MEQSEEDVCSQNSFHYLCTYEIAQIGLVWTGWTVLIWTGLVCTGQTELIWTGWTGLGLDWLDQTQSGMAGLDSVWTGWTRLDLDWLDWTWSGLA